MFVRKKVWTIQTLTGLLAQRKVCECRDVFSFYLQNETNIAPVAESESAQAQSQAWRYVDVTTQALKNQTSTGLFL